MKAVILAGGKGTRLESVTQGIIPKALVKVCQKPILEYQIVQLRANGIHDFIIMGGYLIEQIKEYFKCGDSWGVNISYIEEMSPLGTAGGLYYLKGVIKEDFIIVLGDLLFDTDLTKLIDKHKKSNAWVTLYAHPNAHPYDSDILVADSEDRVVNYLPKKGERDGWYHNLVNSGMYLVGPQIFNYIKAPIKMDLEKDILFQDIMKAGKLYVYRSTEYLIDIGTPQRLKEAEEDLEKGIVARKNLKNKQKAIFLDRDGTINRLKDLLHCPEDLELYDGVAQAIRVINKSGYLCFIVTNQPVVARNLCSIEELERIHMKLEVLLGKEGAYLDDIVYCPHHPDRGYEGENQDYKISCNCRKPQIGMIQKLAQKYHIDLSSSWMVGDTTVDIQTGFNAGMRTILLKTGAAGNDKKYKVTEDYTFENLERAIQYILNVQQEKRYKMNYIKKSIENYLTLEFKAMAQLNVDKVSEVIELIEMAREKSSSIYICGNGGSASTSSHYACDFNKCLNIDLDHKFNFICLNDNISTITAIANDIGYEQIFEIQLHGKLKEEDLLIAVSASGNSKNIIEAVKYAKEIGATVIGLTGFDGGEVYRLADYNLHIPLHNMQIVEDIHLMLNHLIISTLKGIYDN